RGSPSAARRRATATPRRSPARPRRPPARRTAPTASGAAATTAASAAARSSICLAGHVPSRMSVEPALEAELGRRGVDDLLAAGPRHVGLQQPALGPGGAEALVPQPRARRPGQGAERRLEGGEEAVDLAGAVADAAVELEREADDDVGGRGGADQGG